MTEENFNIWKSNLERLSEFHRLSMEWIRCKPCPEAYAMEAAVRTFRAKVETDLLSLLHPPLVEARRKRRAAA